MSIPAILSAPRDAVLGRGRGHALTRAALAFLIVAAAVAPIGLGSYGVEIGFRLLVYIVMAEAWNLLAGYGGIVSLGSASFVGVGAYVLVEALNRPGTPFALAWILAGFAGAALALIASPAVFRLRGIYFTVGTLALSEALRLLMINVSWFGGATGVFLQTNAPPTHILYFYALGLFALTTLVISGYTDSRLSIILRSVRDDQDAAAQLGVRAFRIKLAAFMIASFLMAAAGALQGYNLGAVEPYGMFGLRWSIDVLAIVIIGGLGQRLGPIVGAVFIVALDEWLANLPELHIALTGVILILVVRFAPKGLVGLFSLAFCWVSSQFSASRRSGEPTR